MTLIDRVDRFSKCGARRKLVHHAFRPVAQGPISKEEDVDEALPAIAVLTIALDVVKVAVRRLLANLKVGEAGEQLAVVHVTDGLTFGARAGADAEQPLAILSTHGLPKAAVKPPSLTPAPVIKDSSHCSPRWVDW